MFLGRLLVGQMNESKIFIECDLHRMIFLLHCIFLPLQSNQAKTIVRVKYLRLRLPDAICIPHRENVVIHNFHDFRINVLSRKSLSHVLQICRPMSLWILVSLNGRCDREKKEHKKKRFFHDKIGIKFDYSSQTKVDLLTSLKKFPKCAA